MEAGSYKAWGTIGRVSTQWIGQWKCQLQIYEKLNQSFYCKENQCGLQSSYQWSFSGRKHCRKTFNSGYRQGLDGNGWLSGKEGNKTVSTVHQFIQLFKTEAVVRIRSWAQKYWTTKGALIKNYLLPVETLSKSAHAQKYQLIGTCGTIQHFLVTNKWFVACYLRWSSIWRFSVWRQACKKPAHLFSRN